MKPKRRGYKLRRAAEQYFVAFHLKWKQPEFLNYHTMYDIQEKTHPIFTTKKRTT
jgi:hypothetical protein